MADDQDSLNLHSLDSLGIGYAVFSISGEFLEASDLFLSNLRVDFELLKNFNWKEFLHRKIPQLKPKVLARWAEQKLSKPVAEVFFADYISEFTVVKHFIRLQDYKLNGKKRKLMTLKTIQGAAAKDGFINALPGSNDLKIARRIQKSINNFTIDRVEGRYLIYHFNSLFYPSSFLSGDLITMRQIDRRYFTIFIGDGRGHGVSSALFSSLIHSYTNMMSSYILKNITDTGDLMGKVNKLAYRDFSNTGEFYFFSGIFAIIDGNTRIMKICNAGHPPAYKIDNREITAIESDGPLLGILPKEQYTYKEIDLQDKQAYLFFTDGLYDLPPADSSKTNDERMRLWLNRLYHAVEYDQSKLIRLILGEITLAKTEGRIHDDVSILTMIVEGKPK